MIKYSIVRSNRKTIAIYFNDDGESIIIKCPYYYSVNKIEEFISIKEKVILRKLNKIKNVNNKFEDVLTKKFCLIFGERITYNSNFKSSYYDIANNYLKTRIEEIATTCNLPYNKLILKEYKTKWGSCDKNNNITLNIRLVMLDKKYIDYVIYHELCHTVEFNHKKQFHNTLSKFVPNERILRKELNKFSFILKMEYN